MAGLTPLQANAELELRRQRKAEAEARSYDTLFKKQDGDDYIDKGEKVEGFDSDDDFM